MITDIQKFCLGYMVCTPQRKLRLVAGLYTSLDLPGEKVEEPLHFSPVTIETLKTYGAVRDVSGSAGDVELTLEVFLDFHCGHTLDDGNAGGPRRCMLWGKHSSKHTDGEAIWE